MMEGKDRVEFIINHFEAGNAASFARKIGKSKSAVSKLRRGIYGFTSYADKIAVAYPLINCRWLLTGDGDPVAREATEDEILSRLDRIEKRVASRSLK